MRSKEEIEKQLDKIAEKLEHFLSMQKRTPKMQEEIDKLTGYRDGLQWVLSE